MLLTDHYELVRSHIEDGFRPMLSSSDRVRYVDREEVGVRDLMDWLSRVDPGIDRFLLEAMVNYVTVNGEDYVTWWRREMSKVMLDTEKITLRQLSQQGFIWPGYRVILATSGIEAVWKEEGLAIRRWVEGGETKRVERSDTSHDRREGRSERSAATRVTTEGRGETKRGEERSGVEGPENGSGVARNKASVTYGRRREPMQPKEELIGDWSDFVREAQRQAGVSEAYVEAFATVGSLTYRELTNRARRVAHSRIYHPGKGEAAPSEAETALWQEAASHVRSLLRIKKCPIIPAWGDLGALLELSKDRTPSQPAAKGTSIDARPTPCYSRFLAVRPSLDVKLPLEYRGLTIAVIPRPPIRPQEVPRFQAPSDFHRQARDLLTRLAPEIDASHSALNGVVPGWRFARGRFHREPVLSCYIIIKGAIPLGERPIPKHWSADGIEIPTDILEGYFEAAAMTDAEFEQETAGGVDPIIPGTELDIQTDVGGGHLVTRHHATAGGIVRDQEDRRYLLTAGHVIDQDDDLILDHRSGVPLGRVTHSHNGTRTWDERMLGIDAALIRIGDEIPARNTPPTLERILARRCDHNSCEESPRYPQRGPFIRENIIDTFEQIQHLPFPTQIATEDDILQLIAEQKDLTCYYFGRTNAMGILSLHAAIGLYRDRVSSRYNRRDEVPIEPEAELRCGLWFNAPFGRDSYWFLGDSGSVIIHQESQRALAILSGAFHSSVTGTCIVVASQLEPVFGVGARAGVFDLNLRFE
jgi:hypothetical protein